MQAFCRYDWPGTVRELMNVIERAILICRSNEITLTDLPTVFHGESNNGARLIPGEEEALSMWKGMTLPEVEEMILEKVERLYIKMVLQESRGRMGEAARKSGIHSRSLYNKMKKLGLHKEDFKVGP